MLTNERIAILEKIISIKSVNDNETEVADYIASLFAKYKTVNIQKVNYAENRDNLVVTMGIKGTKQIGFSGHMDVVAPGNIADWSGDPFSPWISDGKLYGRGAADMKGGLAALVVAMLELLEEQIPLSGEVRLLATVGEETGEYGAAQLTKEGYASALDALVIAEPSTNMTEIVYTTRGVIDYKITSLGKAAHSARPQHGINAIDNLLICYRKISNEISKLNKKNEVLGGITHNITQIRGGEQVNSIPSVAEMTGNIRTIPEYPNKELFSIFDEVLGKLNEEKKFNLKVEYMYPQEAVPGKPNSKLIEIAQKTYASIWNKNAKITGGLGSNDSAEFIHAKKHFDYLKIGPGSPTSHQSDEYIEVATYLKSIEFYKKLAISFLNTK